MRGRLQLLIAEEECGARHESSVRVREYETTKGATLHEFAPFRIPHPLSPRVLPRIPPQQSAIAGSPAFLLSNQQFGLSHRSAARLPDTNRLDLTIHRSGSSAAFEIPIRRVTATSESATRVPERIRSGDELSEAP